jgi:phosphoglycerate dehydrogenase-like enzyme
MEVYAYTHSPKPTPESRVDTSGYRVPGTGDPEGTIPERWFSGSVDEFLAQDLDVLVVAVPLREATRGLIGKSQFDILGRGTRKTFLSNIARGPIVDTHALVEALEKGTISGAALDVTDPEPLPRGHPLWTAPNVFISPHIAWQSTNVFTRVLDILFANLERLEKGEPMLNPIKRS